MKNGLNFYEVTTLWFALAAIDKVMMFAKVIMRYAGKIGRAFL